MHQELHYTSSCMSCAVFKCFLYCGSRLKATSQNGHWKRLMSAQTHLCRCIPLKYAYVFPQMSHSYIPFVLDGFRNWLLFISCDDPILASWSLMTNSVSEISTNHLFGDCTLGSNWNTQFWLGTSTNGSRETAVVITFACRPCGHVHGPSLRSWIFLFCVPGLPGRPSLSRIPGSVLGDKGGQVLLTILSTKWRLG